MKRSYLLVAAAAVVAAACGSDPYYNDPGYYSSSGAYPSRVADYNDSGRVVAIDVVGGPGRSGVR